MSLGFIVDASTKIGTGHWSRSLNLSEILNNNNIFFSNSILKKKKLSKIKIIKLNHKKFNIKELKKKLDYYKIKTLIIDNYKFSYNLQKKIKPYVKKLIVIDDFLKKKYFCDLIINYSFLSFKEKAIIKKNNKNKICLLGENYFPSNRILTKFKKKVKARNDIKKIFVFFGSSDNYNITSKALKIVSNFPKIKFFFFFCCRKT